MSNVKPRPRERHSAMILESLAQPAQVNRTPVLVLAVGLPGSGKSTFCRRLALETGATVLESDAIRRLLFVKPTYERAESRQLFAALHASARGLMRSGACVIVDATSLRESDRRPVYKLAEELTARLLVLYFSAPREVIAERLSRRDAAADPEDASSAGLSVYLRMEETLQPPSREHTLIDTSDAVQTEAALRWAASEILGQEPGSPVRHGAFKRARTQDLVV